MDGRTPVLDITASDGAGPAFYGRII